MKINQKNLLEKMLRIGENILKKQKNR